MTPETREALKTILREAREAQGYVPTYSKGVDNLWEIIRTANEALASATEEKLNESP